jgi:pyruvate/2-oxoglutarate dehydrogenase complex dihydrolipoamide dehydrogenase (E3) component
MLSRRLVDEGVDQRLNVETHAVAVTGDGKVVSGTENGNASSWTSEELLVATGRRPNIEGLGLEAAGVHVGPRGVEVDGRMRTSTSSIYAAGDVAGRFFFSHSAGYEGVRAVRDMFFPGKGTVTDLVPWCTFTDPELAHAGLTIEQARSRYGDDVDVWRLDLQHSDRARAESAGDGSVVIVTGKKTRVVGAHILAPAAGEMIHELALAIDQRLKLNEVAGFIHVYPTLSTAIGQLAAEAAFDGARRYRWLVRRERHRS